MATGIREKQISEIHGLILDMFGNVITGNILHAVIHSSVIVMCLCIEKNINLINLMKETLFPFFYQCNFTKTVKGEEVMVTPLMVYDRVLDFPFELSLIQL